MSDSEATNLPTESHNTTLEKLDASWDVVVIGAGPAGSVAAHLIARNGRKTLLIDKVAFPRHKVCGCCLSAAALQALRTAGLEDLADQAGAVKLDDLLVYSQNNKTRRFPLTNSKSLSRERFDSELAAKASESGAIFISGITAHVKPTADINCATMEVALAPHRPEERYGQEFLDPTTDSNTGRTVLAKVIVIADGIGGTSISAFPHLTPEVDPNSRIGAGAISSSNTDHYAAGSIHMAYGNSGYLGLVRLEDGRIDMAAAFDSQYLRECGSIAASAEKLLQTCNMPIPDDLRGIQWKGTMALTRRRQHLAATRIFVIGDSASYVEPFTGEGMGWAMHSAIAVAPFVDRAVQNWQPLLIPEWEREHRIVVGRAQRATRMIAGLLRHEGLVQRLGNVIDKAPPVSSFLVNLVSSQSK